MLNNFSCSVCLSSDSIQLKCGHIQCRPCSQSSNEENIQCSSCNTLPVSNEDIGVNKFNRLCIDCGKNFGSYAEYQRHKKKGACPLMKYGCEQKFDSCSWNKHLYDENHIRATKSFVNHNLESPVNLKLIQVLHEFSSENNVLNKTEVNDDELESFDHLLVLDFDSTSTTHQINDLDNSQLTNEKTQELLTNQLIHNEEYGNLIQSRMDQLDIQLNNEQQQTIISTRQNQLQICHLCQTEYNISLNHICQISANELIEKIKKLTIEVKQLKETNENLLHSNRYLNENRNFLQTELSSIPVSKNGLLIWFIEDIRKKIDESYPPSKRSIDSPRFWSLTGEHPLNVRIFLYGDSNDHPNYISIHLILNSSGNNNLFIPITCCLVDQTINQKHIIQRANINLNQNQIGTIHYFSKFVPTNEVHFANSRFVDNNNTICLIVKLHENQSKQYDHYSMPIRNALEQINLLTVSQKH